MRIHILVASAAALAACGGSTSPATSTLADASSDVAIDHMVASSGRDGSASSGSGSAKGGASVVRHTGSQPLGLGTSASDASAGDTDAGTEDSSTGEDATTGNGTFACGTVTCMTAGQYCSVTKSGSSTSSNCMSVPFACTSGATCGCVQQNFGFDSGMPGCSCADNDGAVTVTCSYP